MQNRRITNSKDRVGKKWCTLFMKRHPELSMRTRQQLGREKAILTKEKIHGWFADLQSYLRENHAEPILSQPDRMYNCDQFGSPLSGLTGRVLTIQGAKTVGSFSNSNRTQTKTGWMDSEIFLGYVKNCFIPYFDQQRHPQACPPSNGWACKPPVA